MEQTLIEGVKVVHMEFHRDLRGHMTEVLREDWEIFSHFGQLTVTLNNPGMIRAWHYHLCHDDLFYVVSGVMKLVLYDGQILRVSKTPKLLNQFTMGDTDQVLVKVPQGVIHGIKTISAEPAILLNMPTKPYDHEHPDEGRISQDSDEIPYRWGGEIYEL